MLYNDSGGIFLKKFLSFIRTYRLVCTIFLIVFVLCVISIPFFFLNTLPLFNDKQSQLEIAETISQILASIFVAIGSFVAVFQYYISSRSEMINLEKDRITKGIDLAEYYKNNILDSYSVVRKIYKDVGIFDLLKKEKNKMHNFDEEELEEIFSANELEDLKNKYHSEEFLNSLGVINEMLDLDIHGFDYKDNQQEGNKKPVLIDKNKALNNFMGNYVSSLLNNIELFAMYFTHNVADESVVYQSLYPTYIEMCQALYYDISKCSAKGGPKLYRNVTLLYDKWSSKLAMMSNNISQNSVNMGAQSGNIR